MSDSREQLDSERVLDVDETTTRKPTAAELLAQGTGLLTRSHLRDLGLERRAIDAAFRECPVIELPGYSRPLIRVEAFVALLDGSTYCDRCGDRVRPSQQPL